jgi:aminoglycoside phosphotransferase (APT) family kinase protein
MASDEAKLKHQLQRWLQGRQPDREGLTITDFTSPTAGASNETLLFDVTFKQDGGESRQGLVVRLEPEGEGIFPEYDLGLQFRTMHRLKGSDVKVPVMLGYEGNRDLLGKPFYVMEKLDGRYLADNPPYQLAGWLTEVSPQTRGDIWENAIRQIAAVHRVDWRERGFEDLWDSKRFETPLAEILDDYTSFLAWAESLGRPFEKLHPVLEYLKNNSPSDEPLTLCWGDAKPPNLMIQGGEIVGVLDWEMVHLGNPVHDLAWWFVLDDSLTDGLGHPKLEGLPDRARMIELWQAESGFSADQLDYYELLSNFQFAVIMHRVGTRLTAQGIFPAEIGFDLNNNCTKLIDAQIEKFGLR